jgi:pimeloyl-ACP methyl ester carboxylesterase
MTIDYDPIPTPSPFTALQELRLPLDALRWAPAWAAMKPGKAKVARTVILLPGFGASPSSMRLMETFLRKRGHRVRDWGLGRNTGEAKAFRMKLAGVVQQTKATHGEKVALVGWSLGGFIAREYAREHPGEVRQVITLGSPVIGGPRYTATANRYRAKGHDLDQLEQNVKDRYQTPLTVPVTAIYSKRDGVVAWQACIDKWSPNVKHIEVSETHVGLGYSPRVMEIIAEALESAA